MNTRPSTALMHAVLDGEATPEERLALERHLAVNAPAKREFDQLARVFDVLARAPRPFAPEGLIASVLANIPQSAPRDGQGRQLFSASRVNRRNRIGSRSAESGDFVDVDRPGGRGNFIGVSTMSGTSGNPAGKRKFIMTGIAIAVAAAIVGYAVDFPPTGRDTAGTITPAERYRATQPGAQDVKLDGVQVGTTGGSSSQAGGGPTAGTNAGNTNAAAVSGAAVNSGGANASSMNAGGMSAGGMNAGGVNAGGMSAGGMSAGGMNAGGAAAGGASAGGMNAGGAAAGGAAAGGANAGGMNAGGVNAGGMNAARAAGGAAAGGASAGGMNAGGANAGGMNAGGATAGGAAAGGANAGGANAAIQQR
jgi:anti-sigma factor RsiW